MNKRNRGITLIALVVTIIILLILAGITISLILGQQGIFGKTETAKIETEIAQLKEELKLSWLTIQIDYEGKVENAEENEVSEKMRAELINYDRSATANYEKANKKITGQYKGKKYEINLTAGEIKIEEEKVPVELFSIVSCKNETSSSSGYLGNTTITREQIESVTIGVTKAGHQASDENCWDVSEHQDEKVLAWYEDLDNDGYYEVTIAGEDGVKANKDASYLFAYIGYAGDDTVCIYGLENLDTSEVTNMSRMFISCGYTAMTNLDLGDKFNTSKVTNMSAMFSFCGYNNMTRLDLGDKFDTSKVTNMSDMFSYCGKQAMQNIDLGDKFDTSNVTDMTSMFAYFGTNAMLSLDLGDKFDTRNVTSMSYMFNLCGYTAMTNLNLGDKFDTSNVTNIGNMFNSCGTLSMTTLSYGNTIENFKTKCANLITNASLAYFKQSNFLKCQEVTCTDGNYTIPIISSGGGGGGGGR